MYTTNLTHEPAPYKYHSGSEFTGRPSLGAWITWGLGSEIGICLVMSGAGGSSGFAGERY
ncbi:MAG UNVERIFIED_CONTAM: DUF1501 domain-containing protein [Planctomycetaceae bacterium]